LLTQTQWHSAQCRQWSLVHFPFIFVKNTFLLQFFGLFENNGVNDWQANKSECVRCITQLPNLDTQAVQITTTFYLGQACWRNKVNQWAKIANNSANINVQNRSLYLSLRRYHTSKTANICIIRLHHSSAHWHVITSC